MKFGFIWVEIVVAFLFRKEEAVYLITATDIFIQIKLKFADFGIIL